MSLTVWSPSVQHEARTAGVRGNTLTVADPTTSQQADRARRAVRGRFTVVLDLEAATGLRTSSLYAAFGDKTGLFRRALEHDGLLVLSRAGRLAPVHQDAVHRQFDGLRAEKEDRP